MVFLPSLYYVLSISSRSLFLMMMMTNLVFAGPTGLTLKLIHRDSPESPLYPGNLTELERMERDFQQSKHREQHLTSWMKSSTWVSSRNNSSSTTNSKSDDLDTVRPEVSLYSGLYLVQIGIGTFANQDPNFYYLFIDTGSNLLWLQCKGNNDSNAYFRQDAPLFDWQTSLTFKGFPVNSSDPFCKKYRNLKVGGFCGYRVRYADGGGSLGILGTEKLTLKADNGGLEGFHNFVFGCGLKQNQPKFGQGQEGKNPIAGIFGLGRGEESFIKQIGDHVQNKFEYCFKPLYDDDHPDTHTFLRFGSDTKIVVGGQGVQTTTTLPVRGNTLYYVTMVGISVDVEPVVYPEGSNVFAPRNDGTGGCIFDSGCAMTQLSAPVYDPLRNHLIKFFDQRYQIKVVDQPLQPPYELCFFRPNGFSQYPTITFHYTGADVEIQSRADFVIEPKAAFKIGNKFFCLNMARSKLINALSVVLGLRQQVNHRILYDLGEWKISWVNENCSVLG